MDSHLLIKIIHMSFASLAILVFVLRATLLFLAKAPDQAVGESDTDTAVQAPSKGRIVLVAMQHLSYSVLIIAGIILLVQNQFVVQPWFYAKIILFFVVLSASGKAFTKKQRPLKQRKAGVVIAAIAFIGIITLIVWKPDFSNSTALVIPVVEQSPIHS